MPQEGSLVATSSPRVALAIEINENQRLRFAIVSFISGSRLVLGGLFVFLALDARAWAQQASLLAFVILFLSDLVDGPLARRLRVVTRIGFILDGLGDRAAYLASLLVMGELFDFSFVAIYLFVLRDLGLYAARSMQTRWEQHHSRTRWLAKFHAGLLRSLFILYFTPFYCSMFGVASLWLRKGLPTGCLSILTVLCLILSYYTLWLVLKGYYQLGGR